ncbi:MAG: methyltransferase domain-containing protein [Rhizobiales bacterium]|nr:methyltransferase domain-containing protein [Hyphomicrobiales bacterium]NRB14283.1 methyltransferase domain-containing protein [Hyphomicrobiales bacterium]
MPNQNQHTFSGLQDIYDAARPTYPPQSIDKLTSFINPDNAEILDIGCGTGILTRQLKAALPGAHIQGCDINSDMIAKAKQSSVGIHYFENVAEDLPFDADQLDLITVGQAVHWFDRPKFYPEVLRVLKQGGTLALVENNRSWQTDKFFARYEDLLEAHSPIYSRHYRDTDYAAEMLAAGFEKIDLHEVIWQRAMTKAEFIDMSCSSSKMAAARKATDDRVLDELRALVGRHTDKAGKITVDYVTRIVSGVA